MLSSNSSSGNDHTVGLDLHEQLVMVKEVGSSMLSRRGCPKASSTYDLPKEIYEVEDDDENTTSQAPIAEPDVSSKFTDAAMPSFNLFLDEDMDEGNADLQDVAVIETEGKECETITEQTIFDHIRRKSKSFPLFATSNSVESSTSTSEVMTPARKRQYGEPLERHKAIKVLEEIDNSIGQRETVIVPDAESPNYIISRSLGSFNLQKEDINEEGVPLSEHEENILERVTEETVFDHIRKKSKNFSVLTSDNLKFEPLIPPRKRFYKDQLELHTIVEGTKSKRLARETMVASGSEMGEMEDPFYGINGDINVEQHIFPGSSSSRIEKPYVSSELGGTRTGQTEAQMPSNKISSVKADFWLSHRRKDTSPLMSTVEYNGSQLHYSNGSTRQLCSSHAVVENSKPAPFLGFKSVFSFL